MKILRILILFIVVLSGCSHKYVDVEEGSVDGKVVASWLELDCEIVEQDERGFSLSLEFKDIAVVSGSAKLVEPYRRSSWEREHDRTPLGILVGLGGCIGGCYYGLHDNVLKKNGYDEDRFNRGCLMSFASCVAGFLIVSLENDDKRMVAKDVPDLIKRDTICVDSIVMSRQKIKISVKESNFEKSYYADENGNIELKFDEIIPEPSEADSVLNLIIQYYELVDTVKVRRL